MKRALIGGFISLLGTIWGLAIAVAASNNLVSGWTTPPRRFLTTVSQMGFVPLFVMAIVLIVLGLDEDQGDLISSALQFGDVTVESVLTPRVDIVAININSSHAELLSLIKSTNHSRLPVYEGSIDNIIGVLQIRKYIKAYLRLGENLDIKPMLDEVLFIHQSTNIDELLPILSRRKLNSAVVTDNYGGTLGIVTVEDILEELVGEIWDEDDVIEEPMVEIGDGVYEVGADETVSDVFDQIGYEDPENDEELVNTLMGEWAYEKFDTIPKPGDSFRYHQVLVTVKDMNHNRIMKLTVALLPAEEEGGEAQ